MKNRPKVDNKWVEEFDKLWDERFGYQGHVISRIMFRDLIKQLLTQTRQETLEWVLEEVVGEDERFTVVAHRYGTSKGGMKKTIGDGEKEWKVPRNELREEQRQTIKKKMEDKE